MTSYWQKRRGAFNHDWLKNQYMPALAKWLNLLDDRIDDRVFEHSFVQSFLFGWESHREEALTLPRDFEKEMSPRRLFEQPPLSRCDVDTKQWLEELVHHLWLARDPVEQWIANATICAKEVDASYTRLQQALEKCADTRSAAALRPLRDQFAEFRERCQDLAKAIEKFPREVRVT